MTVFGLQAGSALPTKAAKACGWQSKTGSLFGYPKYKVPYYDRDPKRDHKFDNHPMLV